MNENKLTDDCVASALDRIMSAPPFSGALAGHHDGLPDSLARMTEGLTLAQVIFWSLVLLLLVLAVLLGRKLVAGSWRLRIAVMAWLAAGLAALVWAAAIRTPTSPTEAHRKYGESRTSLSAAGAGTLALSRLLERLGYEVSLNQRLGEPTAQVLFVLGPTVTPSDIEIAVLLDWVSRGGRIVYGPPSPPAESEEDEEETADGEGEETPHVLVLDDPLSVAAQDRADRIDSSGTAIISVIGSGLVAELADGGEALSNSSLYAHGISAELVWLREVLGGIHHVGFDEGRMGALAQEGIPGLLARSGFAIPIYVAAVALCLLLLALTVRLSPASCRASTPPPSSGELIEELAWALRSSNRLFLANDALLDGTMRRLGALTRMRDAQARLRAIGFGPPVNEAALIERAEALRRLEGIPIVPPQCGPDSSPARRSR